MTLVPIVKAERAVDLTAGVHELYDVDVQRISIVDQGANGKTFFLRKRAELGDRAEQIEVGMTASPIAKADWSAVYCVVAEPGWLEAPGLIGDQAIPDRWASEDEIRKACHRFAKNGGAINRMHESIDPYGTLVENAIALDDFTITGPDGNLHTIRKGSWYIAIEPNAEGRKAIEDGTFNGVSIEGGGVRKLVAKAREYHGDDPGERDRLGRFARVGVGGLPDGSVVEIPGEWGGTYRVQGKVRDQMGTKVRNAQDVESGSTVAIPVEQPVKVKSVPDVANDALGSKLRARSTTRAALRAVEDEIDDYETKIAAEATSDDERAKLKAAVVRLGRTRNELRAELSKREAAVAKAKSADPAARRGTVDKVKARVLKKIGKAVGLSDDDLAELDEDEIAKGTPTFAERMAQRDLDEELPQAMDVLRSTVWSAFFPYDTDDDTDPRDVISTSLDEFKSWALDLLDRVPLSKLQPQLDAEIEKGADPRTLSDTVEDVLTDEQKEQLAKAAELSDKIDGLPAAIAKAIRGEGEGGDDEGEGGDEPATLDSIAKTLGEVVTKQEAQDRKIEALGSGGQSPTTPATDPTQVAKRQNGDGDGDEVRAELRKSIL